ncbi:SPASM domain-containing protein [bacterium]|nr:SPASM domain-containing protein [bacterium]
MGQCPNESSIASNYLTSLWIETPANCVLQCPMCFANTIPLNEPAPQNIPSETYEMIIRDFALMEGSSRKTLAIPGAGEPFHKYNHKLTWRIIELAVELGMPLTIFTTAHLMTEKDIEKLKEYKNVLLLVKLNSRNREIQNSLVFKDPKNPSDPSYFDEREKKLNMLIGAGFTETSDYEKEKFGLATRLGIVTSIMHQNINEVVDLLNWARTGKMIFDCDTILPRGRGERFNQTRDILSGQELDKEIRDKIAELQKIDSECFQSYWPTGGTYVGAKCTRFCNHLYIDAFGKVHPCIGAIDVVLGEVSGSYRLGTLKKIWNNPLMKIIRGHKYTGTCATCINFITGNCYSCLGRCTVKDEADKKLTNENLEKHKVVFTRGCLNYRPKILVLIAESSANLSNIFSEKDSLPRELVKDGKLEYLWLPKQDSVEPSTEEIRVWKDTYRERLVGAPWRWDLNKQLNLVPRLLGRSFLPTVSALFNEDCDPHEMLLWVNLVLYDEITGKYFYRMVVREQEDEYNLTVLLSRWAESDDLYNKDEMAEEERNILYSERILDLSDVLKDPDTGKRFDYRVVFTDKHDPSSRKKIGGVSSPEIFDVSDFIKEKLVAEHIRILRKEAPSIIKEEKWPVESKPVELLMRKRVVPLKQVFIENCQTTTTIGLDENEQKFVKSIYERIANCFFAEEDKELIPDIPEQLSKACVKSLQIQEDIDIKVRLANYIVYTAAMHNELAGYEVRHSYLHAESILNPSSAIIMASRLPKNQTSARKTLTPEQLPDELIAAGEITIQMFLAPIIRVYEEGIKEEKSRLLRLLRDFPHLILDKILTSSEMAFKSGQNEQGEAINEYIRGRGRLLDIISRSKDDRREKFKKDKIYAKKALEEKIRKLGIFVGKYKRIMWPDCDNWGNALKEWGNLFQINGGDFEVDAYPYEIETIFENLVDNAIKHGVCQYLIGFTKEGRVNKETQQIVRDEILPEFKLIFEFDSSEKEIVFTDSGFGCENEEEMMKNFKKWQIEGPDGDSTEGFGIWLMKQCLDDMKAKWKLTLKKNSRNRYNLIYTIKFE